MSSVPAVQEFEVGREFVLESCVNVPEGLVGRTRGESPSDDSSGILHATDPPPSEPQTDSPLPSLLLSTLRADRPRAFLLRTAAAPPPALRYLRARGCYGTQTYGTSDPGGSRARGRARARAEHPTWAYRVWYRELGPIGMFRRKWLSASIGKCPRKIPVKHIDRLEELTDCIWRPHP